METQHLITPSLLSVATLRSDILTELLTTYVFILSHIILASLHQPWWAYLLVITIWTGGVISISSANYYFKRYHLTEEVIYLLTAIYALTSITIYQFGIVGAPDTDSTQVYIAFHIISLLAGITVIYLSVVPVYGTRVSIPYYVVLILYTLGGSAFLVLAFTDPSHYMSMATLWYYLWFILGLPIDLACRKYRRHLRADDSIQA